MLKSAKFFWKGITPERIALSVSLGVTLGICFSGSANWLIILSLCLILRTHILSLLTGWAAGFLLKTVLAGLYEPVGKAILLSNKVFWQSILSKPVICYLNLSAGHIMGNLFIAIICGLFSFIVLLSVLKISQRNKRGKQYENHSMARC